MLKWWKKVAVRLRDFANDDALELNVGQRASLKVIAQRLPKNGIIIADEVGMGKTRIATTVTKAVIDAGGRVAILVPPGLGFQWGDELRKSGVHDVPPILRSLWQYLKAWENQENPVPWFEQKAVLISHAFCNWRLGENAEAWRWTLLPEIYAQWRKLQKGCFPPNYCGNDLLSDDWVRQAAWSIANAVSSAKYDHPSRQRMNEIADQKPWQEALNGGAYVSNGPLRLLLQKAVGLGLGTFDLIVIDEAHKSRGQESGLNRLLESVVLPSGRGRRLAMTATPIELDVGQWQKILERIDVKDDQANTAITNYSAAAEQVRKLPNDEHARKQFAKAAQKFQAALSQYLLRRDKREVQSVKQFDERSRGKHGDYRRLSEITVPVAGLSPAWKQAVCSAEALSFVTRGLYGADGKKLSRNEIEKAKRLRLTMGNGHGISTLIDELQRDTSKKKNSNKEQEDSFSDIEGSGKKLKRIEWWNGVMSCAFQNKAGHTGEAALYEHPAILAAVKAIEAVCGGKQGEKVLVFGRFTRPMQALVRLLNAREMLRRLDENSPRWPQAAVHEDEKVAVLAALRQLKKNDSLGQINQRLDKQYKELEKKRERFRTQLREVLEQRLDEERKEHALTLFARPIHEILATDDPTDDKILSAFKAVVAAASDQDKETATTDDEAEGNAVNQFNEEILQRIEETYGRSEGGFARLMNGSTQPHTRRLLQLAFNREHSYPKVLVVQSVVGREGLNLHEACRTVILLHAEWNPGVVEQQIGRVDRINSLWEKKLKEALATPADELPRIEIRPVIFQGTYDEHNWKVLMQRWDDLRAQLHGVVITPSTGEKLPLELVKTINACAPNFSPTQSSC